MKKEQNLNNAETQALNMLVVRRSCFNCKNLIKDSETTPVNAICKHKCFCSHETTLEELKEPVHCLLHNYA